MTKTQNMKDVFYHYYYRLVLDDLYKKTVTTYIDGDYKKDIDLHVDTYYYDNTIHFCQADRYPDYAANVCTDDMTWTDIVTEDCKIREYTFNNGVKVRLVTDLTKGKRAGTRKSAS